MVLNKIDTEQIQTDHQYYYDWENQVCWDSPAVPESEVDTTPYLSAPIDPIQIAQAPSELTLSALGVDEAERMMVAYLEGKGGTEEKVIEAYAQIYETLLILEEQYGDQPGVAKKLQALRKELYQRLAETAERFGAKGRALVKQIADCLVALENTHVECAKVVTIIIKGERIKGFANVSPAVKTDAPANEKQETRELPLPAEEKSEEKKEASVPSSPCLTAGAGTPSSAVGENKSEDAVSHKNINLQLEEQKTLNRTIRLAVKRLIDRVFRLIIRGFDEERAQRLKFLAYLAGFASALSRTDQ